MKPIVGSGRYRYNKLINQENNLWAKTSERSVLASFCSLGDKSPDQCDMEKGRKTI